MKKKQNIIIQCIYKNKNPNLMLNMTNKTQRIAIIYMVLINILVIY